MQERHAAIVIGAGPGGLAAAAELRRNGVHPVVLEASDAVAASWRRHYDRLHLHTTRRWSGLPAMPIPSREGRWVSRDGVVRYLEAYAARNRLDVRPGHPVERIDRDDGEWLVTTGAGPLRAPTVVVATGHNRIPHIPDWPGVATFTGEVVHSQSYRNPVLYRGRSVLVVGTGNSVAEIAADLVEGGAARVSLSVRTPPTILPRALLGVPTQGLGILLRRLPPAVVDRVAGITQRLVFGDLSRYGMPRPTRGMYTRVLEDDAIPVLDVGLVRLLKRRRIEVVTAVERFDGPVVHLAGGGTVRPDAVIAATGFGRGLEPLVGHLGVLGVNGRPRFHGARTAPGLPGLHFIGYTNPVSGNLREMAIDARRIGRAVAGQSRRVPARTQSR